MKVSAFAFTSGLEKEIEGPIESPPSDLIDMISTSSSSGELHRELWALRILTKSPRATNLDSGILNGGGGGGGGIGMSGDGGAIVSLSLCCVLRFVGFGGLPVLISRRLRGSAGGGAAALWATSLRRLLVLPFVNKELSIDEGGGGGGGGAAVYDRWNRLLLPPVLKKLLKIEFGGGGGGGGGGGAVVDCWNRLVLLPVLNKLLKIEFGGGGGGGGGEIAMVETECTRLLLPLFLNRFCNTLDGGGGGGGGGGDDGVDGCSSTEDGEEL